MAKEELGFVRSSHKYEYGDNMNFRRVVTGHTSDGEATVVSDGVVERAGFSSGVEIHKFWGSDTILSFPDNGKQPIAEAFFPPVNGFRFLTIVLPPNSEGELDEEDNKLAEEQFEEKFPDALALMESANPGMHASDTVDLAYVISGDIWLELDNSEEINLEAGDIIVQNGTRHRWHNRSNEPCCLMACMIGAERV